MLVCDVCGEGFRARGSTKVCSDECRTLKNRQRQRAAYAPRCFIAFAECDLCGDLFAARSAKRTRCYSTTCSKAHHVARRSAYISTESGASAATRAKRAYREKRRSAGLPIHANTEARRALYQRRRAAKRGTGAESFLNSEIFDRDNWTCGICDQPVNPTLTYPDPMSVSLDHITPLSLGGEHSRANTRCSHLACNVRRGNRAA